ncbi:MAG: hypothetical protein JSR82_09415 [Verrucomicrobia bacterium]|nr:hypothetical protein [Verrucomicrobiota bacterium]
MLILRPLLFVGVLLGVLLIGSVLAARLHAHQTAREQAAALDRPEARVALQRSWPVR